MRYGILLSMTVVLFASCQPSDKGEAPASPPAATESVDPTVVAPEHYKVVLENDRVRVLQISYAEGEETPMHSHPDAVAIFLEDGTVEMRLPDGTTQQPAGKAGEALWTPAGAHSPKAVTPVSVILVELKDGGGEAAMAEASATDVAPDHYKVALENDRVRVLQIRYAEGEEAPMHSHPEGVAVFVVDGTVEMRLPDGTTQRLAAKAGDALWTPADTHSPKALTEVSVLQVELKGSGG
jgi:quercetin dioxygenase-like cupin family protein